MKTTNYKLLRQIFATITFLLTNGSFSVALMAQNNDSKLLDDFIKAQGYQDVIIFDASNIKQFWTDNSVISQNELIKILLNNYSQGEFESIPLKIRLQNINITMNCKIDVVSDDPLLSFTVSTDKAKDISTSQAHQEFIDYHVVSKEFPIVSLQNNSFSFVFKSNKNSFISIKKIVLSFSSINSLTNEFDSSSFSKKNILLSSSKYCDGDDIMIRGKKSKITLKEMISTEGKEEFWASTKIKNTGDEPTNIYIGYVIYNEDKIALRGNNYPYDSKNPILTVVSAEQGSNTITVDKQFSWKKNCYIALDPKDDDSDIPSVNFLSSKLVNVTEESNGQATITLDSPLDVSLEKGSKIRIHGQSGGYIYTDKSVLNPGDEFEFSSIMKKDDSFLQYSPVAFSRGVSYITPLILSYSENEDKENTILISDLQLYSASK